MKKFVSFCLLAFITTLVALVHAEVPHTRSHGWGSTPNKPSEGAYQQRVHWDVSLSNDMDPQSAHGWAVYESDAWAGIGNHVHFVYDIDCMVMGRNDVGMYVSLSGVIRPDSQQDIWSGTTTLMIHAYDLDEDGQPDLVEEWNNFAPMECRSIPYGEYLGQYGFLGKVKNTYVYPGGSP